MKILFIGHNAGYTGAPKSLLRIITYLTKKSGFHCEALLRDGGPLVAEYQKVVNTHVHIPSRFYQSKNRWVNFFRKVALRLYWKKLYGELASKQFDLLYCNTIVPADLVARLKKDSPNSKVVVHIREMEVAIEHYGGLQLMKRLDRMTDQYIVVSKAVSNTLVEKYGIQQSKIAVIYNFLEESEFTLAKRVTEGIAEPPFNDDQAFIVGNVGAVSWRKGYDFFLAIAKNVKSISPTSNIKFVWIGHIEDEVLQRLNYDIRFAGLENQVFFIGQRPHPYEYYPLMDVFLLTSRDDPFPLSAMEAGYYKLPVLSFKNTGGIPEFLDEIQEVNFEYLDIQAVSAEIIALYKDDNKRTMLGESVRKKLFEELNIDRQLSKIIAILDGI